MLNATLFYWSVLESGFRPVHLNLFCNHTLELSLVLYAYSTVYMVIENTRSTLRHHDISPPPPPLSNPLSRQWRAGH